ncbi:BTAD domain-containing putative transcriptional regulator [Dongia sp.]|uniref:BTAD domain-containing putative transcriptional regulator n=1 Tax=Dongia sp. TaxID=1977262 RepID=UPI0037536771
MAAAELTLFGKFELKLAEGQVVDLPGQKDRALLAFLALAPGISHSRDKLAALLWSEHGEAQARDSLKHALSRIRQSLAGCSPNAIMADRQSVRFDASELAIDVLHFQQLLRQQTPEAREQAGQICIGDLLDDIAIRDAGFEDWLVAERQRLRRMLEEALSDLLAPALPAATRERAARRMLSLDPLRETAIRALMQVHAERGEIAQALRLFETTRDRLHAELGVKPNPETIRLYDEIREGKCAVPPQAVPQPKTPDLSLPSKPSIAVLPFENLSGDPEQEYFADGMVEDITTALSRMRWLFVIARNSSFTYRGKSVDVKQIGRELGVRYLLEGSVRKAGHRVRISGRLIDAESGAHLWADRFDGSLEEVFELQDQIAATVAAAITPKLEQAEIERAKSKPTENLDAYDHFLRGLASLYRWNRSASDRALAHFYAAIEIDPDYASAYGYAARCYSSRKVSGWVGDREHEVAESARLARKVAEIGKDDAVALGTAGMALAYVVGDLDDGAAMIDRSLQLNPNAGWTWLFSGWTRLWMGEPAQALERLERAMRMSPQDPQTFNIRTATGWAHLLAGRYADAVDWARLALAEQPDYLNALYVLAAASASNGNQAEAEEAMRRLLANDPTARVSLLQQRYPFRHASDREHVSDALRRAGMAE